MQTSLHNESLILDELLYFDDYTSSRLQYISDASAVRSYDQLDQKPGPGVNGCADVGLSSS
jgi:hypothetical protein